MKVDLPPADFAGRYCFILHQFDAATGVVGAWMEHIDKMNLHRVAMGAA
jgi:hypothetical protein